MELAQQVPTRSHLPLPTSHLHFRADIWEGFQRILFPARGSCWLCQQAPAASGMCSGCQQELLSWRRIYFPCRHCGTLQLEKRPLCAGCSWEPPPFKQARAAGPYTGHLRQAVNRLKYRGETWLAEEIARLMVDVFREAAFPARVITVPVPLHPRRQRERSYNQAELLARELGRLLGSRVASQALDKVRPTAPQVGLPRAERLRNLRDAFAVGPQARVVAGQPVLLVDDVFTTGATASECTRVLRAAGAIEVYVLTVATAVRR